MADLNRDDDIVEAVLQRHAAIPYAYGQIETLPVFDHERRRYLLMDAGWLNEQRYHGCLAHVAIRDGKVWIEYDGLEDGIASALIAAGIAPERIVLGYQRPDLRAHADTAAA